MKDFLKAMPSVSRDEYLWEWTVPQIQLSLFDQTRVEYLNEAQAEMEKQRRNSQYFSNAQSLASDLGVKII